MYTSFRKKSYSQSYTVEPQVIHIGDNHQLVRRPSIAHLSSELLLRIFMFNTVQDCRRIFDPLVTMMVCSQVCRRWRRITFRNPLLWNNLIDLSKSSKLISHVVHLSGHTQYGTIVLPSVTPLLLSSATLRTAIRKHTEVPVVEILITNNVPEPNYAKRLMTLFTVIGRAQSLILKMPYHGWMMLDFLFSNDISHLETLVLIRDDIDSFADRKTTTVATLNAALRQARHPWRLTKLLMRGCGLDLRESKALTLLEELVLHHLPRGVAWTTSTLLEILGNMPRLVRLELIDATVAVKLPTYKSALPQPELEPSPVIPKKSPPKKSHRVNKSSPMEIEEDSEDARNTDDGELEYPKDVNKYSPSSPSTSKSGKQLRLMAKPKPKSKSNSFQDAGPSPAAAVVQLRQLCTLFIQAPIEHVCDIFLNLRTPIGCNITLECQGITSVQMHSPNDPVNKILQAMKWRFEDRTKARKVYTGQRIWNTMIICVSQTGLIMKVFDSNTDHGQGMALRPRRKEIDDVKISLKSLDPSQSSFFDLTFEWNKTLTLPLNYLPRPRIDPFLVLKRLAEHIADACPDIVFLYLQYTTPPPQGEDQRTQYTEFLLTFLERFKKVEWLDRITVTTFEFLIPYLTYPFNNRADGRNEISFPTIRLSPSPPSPSTPLNTSKEPVTPLPDPLESLTSFHFVEVDFSINPIYHMNIQYTLVEILTRFIVRRLNQDNYPKISTIVFRGCTGITETDIANFEGLGVAITQISA